MLMAVLFSYQLLTTVPKKPLFLLSRSRLQGKIGNGRPPHVIMVCLGLDSLRNLGSVMKKKKK